MPNKEIEREVLILAIHCNFFICSLLLFFYLGVQLYLNIAEIRIAMHMKCTAQSKGRVTKPRKKLYLDTKIGGS